MHSSLDKMSISTSLSMTIWSLPLTTTARMLLPASPMISCATSLKAAARLCLNLHVLYFKPRFGHDFSRVWLHTDIQAAESVRARRERGGNARVIFLRDLGHELLHEGAQAPLHCAERVAALPAGLPAEWVLPLSPLRIDRTIRL